MDMISSSAGQTRRSPDGDEQGCGDIDREELAVQKTRSQITQPSLMEKSDRHPLRDYSIFTAIQQRGRGQRLSSTGHQITGDHLPFFRKRLAVPG